MHIFVMITRRTKEAFKKTNLRKVVYAVVYGRLYHIPGRVVLLDPNRCGYFCKEVFNDRVNTRRRMKEIDLMLAYFDPA